MSRKFLSIMMVAVMVIVMAAACGKKETAESEKKEETKVEAAEKEDEVEPEEAADDEQHPAEAEAPVNEYGFTDLQVENLYKSIKESVETSYMRQKNISTTEFVWPDVTDVAWRYVDSKLFFYGGTGDKNVFPDDIDPNFDTSLAEPIYMGIINWLDGLDQSKTSKNLSSVRAMLDPMCETIPTNVTFTE